MKTMISKFEYEPLVRTFSYLLLLCLFTACSDLSDYNSEPTDATSTADRTLWDNLTHNAQTQKFVAIAQKAGFDDELQSSHFYTVWAPVDGTYNADSLLAINDTTTLLRQFVQNHIANYGHSVQNESYQRITMLNGKSYELRSGFFDGLTLTSTDNPGINGIIHTLSGVLPFRHNIYEYLMSSSDLDSLQAYYKQFEETILDEKHSILGPIIGGEQTYIDSVMVTTNKLFSRFHANINEEDSNFTALLPTNEAWQKAYNRIRPYYNYAAKTAAQDLTNDNSTPTIIRNIDAVYYADELTKQMMVGNLFLNNNHEFNAWIRGYAEKLHGDTIQNTNGRLLSNGSEFIKGISTIKMSNGLCIMTDTLPFISWETFAPEITVSTTSATYRPRLLSATATTVRLNEEDIDSSKGIVKSYADLVPSGTRSLPDVFFYLPNVLSTSYNIYAVIVPANIKKGYIGEVKPNKFSATITYSSSKGTLLTQTLGTDFVNDTSKVDTLLLGKATFPVCYRNLGELYPTLELKSNLRIFNSAEMAAYDRQLRLAAIILRPIEMDTL